MTNNFNPILAIQRGKTFWRGLAGKQVHGENVKKNGEKRKWEGVATGKVALTNSNELLIEVFDLVIKEKRKVLFHTFTGSIGKWKINHGVREN